MNFEYVWEVLQIRGQPPQDEKFRLPQGAYKYYPFSHHGSIFTADLDLWDLSPLGTSSDGTSNVMHWPNSNEIMDFVAQQCDPDTWLLMVFSDQPLARTIDPGATVELSKFPSSLNCVFPTGFLKVGFDVIDISGLSALTNVGYTADDLSKLAAMAIEINQHGLISTSNGSYRFAEFASLAAPEHAPFFPVEVWVLRPAED